MFRVTGWTPCSHTAAEPVASIYIFLVFEETGAAAYNYADAFGTVTGPHGYIL